MDKTHCLLVAIYPVLIGLVLDLLIAAIGASLFKITFYSLRLIDCLKIITYCATVPVILSAILNFVNPMFNDGILVILLSLFFSLSQPKRTTEYPWFLKSLEQKSLWIFVPGSKLINGGNRTNSFGNKPKFSKN